MDVSDGSFRKKPPQSEKDTTEKGIMGNVGLSVSEMHDITHC